MTGTGTHAGTGAGAGTGYEGAPMPVTPMTVGRAPDGGGPAVFRAGCPHCRTSFELPAGELRLTVGASARTTFYSFTCPECGEAVRKPAGERIVELLTGGGVRTLRLQR